jgi:hypothetical protein
LGNLCIPNARACCCLKLLLDAQLSPFITHWIEDSFGIECVSFHHLNWQTTEDEEAFLKAKEMNAVVLTKDEDSVGLFKKTQSPSYHYLAYMRQYFQQAVERNSFFKTKWGF